MLRWFLTERLRRRLRYLFPHLYIAGNHHLRPWQDGSARSPLLLYCSHNGWSDVALAVVLSRRLFHLRSSFLIERQQLDHLPTLRFLGGVILPWDNPPALQELLPEALPRLLRHHRVLWVFATGALLSVGETDTLWSCADLVRSAPGPIALSPVVWSYRLLQSEPACYLCIGKPELWGPESAPSTLVEHCSRRLLQLYNHQQSLLSTGALPASYRRYSL